MFGQKKNNTAPIDSEEYQEILDEARELIKVLKVPIKDVFWLMAIKELRELNKKQ